MRVAIIHYWLVGMRGGEKVIEALCEMYPQADIFTHVYVPEMVSDRIRQHRIIPTFINSLPRASKMYKTYLPLMPLALEQLDLRGYDLIISSESGPAKGIIAPSEALHVEHVPRLPQQRGPRGAADDAAAYALPADVGRDVCGAGRQLCCELGDGCKTHPPILRSG